MSRLFKELPLLKQDFKRAPVSWVIVGISILLFIIEFSIIYPIVGEKVFLKYFALNPYNPSNIITWVTSMFSHGGILHLAINMFVFIGFGRKIELELGAKKFVTIIFVTGLSASLLSVIAYTYILPTKEVYVIGTSGFIAGVIGLYSIQNPEKTVFFLFLIPLNSLFAVMLFIALSLVLALTFPMSIAHFSHIGGILSGMALGIYYSYTGVLDTNTSKLYNGLLNRGGETFTEGIESTFQLVPPEEGDPDYLESKVRVTITDTKEIDAINIPKYFDKIIVQEDNIIVEFDPADCKLKKGEFELDYERGTIRIETSKLPV